MKFFVFRHVSIILWGFRNHVCPSVCSLYVPLSLHREKKSLWLRQQQSYTVVTNWCINGKFFTNTTAWKPKNLIFFSKKVEIEFWLVIWFVLNCWNHPSFVNISPTVVFDASMERPSRVHYNMEIQNLDILFKGLLWFSCCHIL